MKRKIYVLITLMFILCVSGCASKAVESSNSETKTKSYEGFYEYPVITDDMKSDEILDACRIDKEVLESMSTEQLVEAVFDFPLLCDVCYSDYKMFYTEVLKSESDAYAELLKRDDAKDTFILKIGELEEKNADSVLIETVKKIALNEPVFKGQLTAEEVTFLE